MDKNKSVEQWTSDLDSMNSDGLISLLTIITVLLFTRDKESNKGTKRG